MVYKYFPWINSIYDDTFEGPGFSVGFSGELTPGLDIDVGANLLYDLLWNVQGVSIGAGVSLGYGGGGSIAIGVGYTKVIGLKWWQWALLYANPATADIAFSLDTSCDVTSHD